MQSLIDGYRRFREQAWPHQRELYEKLAEGQTPQVLVIACSDSRVDPATIFDARPGELFIIRNVANVVPPYEENPVGLHGTSAAIEFAVMKLKVRTILVLGHGRCGGVAAALDDQQVHGTFIDGWVALLDAAKTRIPSGCEDVHSALERENIKLSIERLRSFPFVAQAVQEGRLTLEGGIFAVADGRLERLDSDSAEFRPVHEISPKARPE